MINTVKKKLQSVIYDSLIQLDKENSALKDIEQDKIKIEYPNLAEHGDYSTPIAMELARILKKSPLMIAEDIKANIKTEELIEKIEIVKPGFINFFFKNTSFKLFISEIINKKKYGSNSFQSEDRILLEYVSANPTGPLHIGHGRWAAIGDVLANILEYAGYKIDREFYINDAGNQIKKLKDTIQAVKESREIPVDGYHGEYIKDIAALDQDPVEFILNQQKETLSAFRSQFDNFYHESDLYKEKIIEKLITFLKEKEYIYNMDGAVWFKSSQFGDDKDRVLIKEDGSYTYFAVDIAYHYTKVTRNYNRLINVFGADHHGYVKRLTIACSLISDNNAELIILIGQLVNLFREGEPVRMSKRTGDIITLQEVMDEIGVDAARYYLSSLSADTPLDFDLAVAQQKSADNPVYYIQYAYARIQSLFRNAVDKSLQAVEEKDFDYSRICGEDTDRIVKQLIKFPDEIREIADSYEIYRLHRYLYDTASLFHKFYFNNKILDTENQLKSNNYLYFIRAVEQILSIGLSLLKITAPSQM